VLADSSPSALVALQLKLAHAVCTFEIFKYCLSQRTFGGSQGLQEIVGFGFPSTWQISDAVCSRSTKNLFASVTLGEIFFTQNIDVDILDQWFSNTITSSTSEAFSILSTTDGQRHCDGCVI